jgi:hypothetical protein
MQCCWYEEQEQGNRMWLVRGVGQAKQSRGATRSGAGKRMSEPGCSVGTCIVIDLLAARMSLHHRSDATDRPLRFIAALPFLLLTSHFLLCLQQAAVLDMHPFKALSLQYITESNRIAGQAIVDGHKCTGRCILVAWSHPHRRPCSAPSNMINQERQSQNNPHDMSCFGTNSTHGLDADRTPAPLLCATGTHRISSPRAPLLLWTSAL